MLLLRVALIYLRSCPSIRRTALLGNTATAIATRMEQKATSLSLRLMQTSFFLCSVCLVLAMEFGFLFFVAGVISGAVSICTCCLEQVLSPTCQRVPDSVIGVVYLAT